MKKVKITVLKCDIKEDLVKEFGKEGLGPCSVMNPGQTFIAGLKCPEGMCDTAWRCISQYVFALQNGAERFFFDNWAKEPRTAISCCNDGFRPVYFKIETIDEEIENIEKK